MEGQDKEVKVILVSLFVQLHFNINSQSLLIRTFFSSWYREGIFLTGEFYGLFLGRKGVG